MIIMYKVIRLLRNYKRRKYISTSDLLSKVTDKAKMKEAVKTMAEANIVRYGIDGETKRQLTIHKPF